MSESITCPRCGLTSYHPRDVVERYCGNCRLFHADLGEPPPLPDRHVPTEADLDDALDQFRRGGYHHDADTGDPPPGRPTVDLPDLSELRVDADRFSRGVRRARWTALAAVGLSSVYFAGRLLLWLL